MSEKSLRAIFLVGTAFFMLIFVGLTINSLRQINQGRTPPVTADVAAGKRIWQRRDCNDCHTILGIGGYYAPDLTKVINTRGAAWLTSWLTNPAAVNPQAQMPNQTLTAVDVQNLVAFFTWVGQVNTNNWPPQPLTNQGAASSPSGLNGTLLFDQKGCSGCHRVNGQGAPGPGPDLSQIATQPYDALGNSAAELKTWLQDPAAVKPGTLMPKLALTQPEIDALVTYLLTLK